MCSYICEVDPYVGGFVVVTEIDGIDPDEKIFLERLNNSSRFYETIPRAVRTAANRPAADPNTSAELVNNVKNRTPRLVTFPQQQVCFTIYA